MKKLYKLYRIIPYNYNERTVGLEHWILDTMINNTNNVINNKAESSSSPSYHRWLLGMNRRFVQQRRSSDEVLLSSQQRRNRRNTIFQKIYAIQQQQLSSINVERAKLLQIQQLLYKDSCTASWVALYIACIATENN